MPFAFRHLALERPLAVLDAETTGLDPRSDRVAEVSVLRLAPDAEPTRYRRLIDPGVPIPAAASAVHAITDADVAGRRRFGAIAPGLARLLEGADLAGFNVRRFDLPFLAAEFRRTGVDFRVPGRALVDALQAFHRFEPRDLAVAVRRYCGAEHQGAHSALAHAEAAAAVLDAQIGAHAELPATVGALHLLLTEVDVGGRFRRGGLRAVLAFGKHAGRPLSQVARSDPGYLRWFLGQDFLDDPKALVDRALEQAGSGPSAPPARREGPRTTPSGALVRHDPGPCGRRRRPPTGASATATAGRDRSRVESARAPKLAWPARRGGEMAPLAASPKRPAVAGAD